MFERFFSPNKLISSLLELSGQKLARQNDLRFVSTAVAKQVRLLDFLKLKEERSDSILLREVSSYLSDDSELKFMEGLGMLKVEQKRVLTESLNAELAFVKEYLLRIAHSIASQSEMLGGAATASGSTQRLQSLQSLIAQEQSDIMALSNKMKEGDNLKTRLAENVTLVKKLRHSPAFRKLTKRISRMIHSTRFKVVISGSENLPKLGPVVIAPRHFHGDYDPSLMKKVIDRDFFFLSATDWAKGGFKLKVAKWAMEEEGAPAINRLDSIFKHTQSNYLSAFKKIVGLLMLNQAVVVFPEGYGKIDSNYTPSLEKDGFLELKLGVFHFVDYVQKKRGAAIPIVPIGTYYEDWEKIGSLIVVNIGKSIFIPVSNSKMDYTPFKLQLDAEIKRLSKPNA